MYDMSSKAYDIAGSPMISMISSALVRIQQMTIVTSETHLKYIIVFYDQ